MKYLLILLLFPATCFAQQQQPLHDYTLKINATSLIDLPSFPTLQLSLEKRVYKNITLSGELGTQLYNHRRTDTAFVDPAGLKANVELRVYDPLFRIISYSHNALSELYAGINVFYRQNRYNNEIPYQSASDSLDYLDVFSVHKKNQGINLVIGYQSLFSQKYTVDFYSGIGWMRTDIKNNYREIGAEDRIIGTDMVPLFASWNLSESSGNKFNFNFGVRLGILLK